jgi:hypothetical protein
VEHCGTWLPILGKNDDRRQNRKQKKVEKLRMFYVDGASMQQFVAWYALLEEFLRNHRLKQPCPSRTELGEQTFHLPLEYSDQIPLHY